MAKSLKICTVGICFLALANTAVAADYYVSMSGNDANRGTSRTAAFKTIKKAAEVAVHNDRVYVTAGTYADTVEIKGLSTGTGRVSFIGDPGAIIAGQVNVVNSNNVELNGFTFSGGATRFLIWKDSYDGLIKDCTFTSGDEGLLIKNASLEIDGCEIKDFAHDGIQVDGLTKMFIHNTKITGCGDSGMEIRKIAKIVLDTCTVTNNAGDGIEVNVTTDTLDDGIVTSSGIVPLALGMVKLDIKDQSQIYSFPTGVTDRISSEAVAYGNAKVGIESTATLHGDLYYGPSGATDIGGSSVTGNTEQLRSSLSLRPIDPGSAATSNNNGSIPKTSNGKTALASGKLTVDSGDSLNLPAGTYCFQEIEAFGPLDISGPTVIYVTDKARFERAAPIVASRNPSDLRLYITGNYFEAKDCGSFTAAVYGPNARLWLEETSFIGVLIGSELTIAQSKVILDKSLDSLAESWIVGGVGTNAAATTPVYTDADFTGGILDISGSTFSGNDNGVRMTTEQNFSSRFTDYSNNTNFGLELFGTCRIENLTIDSNGVGGIWLNQTGMGALTVSKLSIANNTQFGVYADNSDMGFDNTNIADWAISGSQIAVAAVTSDITFQNVTMSGGSTAAVHLTQGNMKASGATFSGSGYGLAIDSCNVWLMSCTFSDNTVGLYASRNGYLSVSNSTFTGNSLWGASVTPSGTTGETATFSGCTFSSNAGGLSLAGAANGDVLLRDVTVIRDNTAAGLHFENCDLAVNDQAGGANWSTLRNLYGISSNQSTLALTQIRVQDSTSYGVLCQDSTVSLSGCTVTGPHGIYADAANDSLTIDGSVFASGATPGSGVRRYGGTLDVTNSTFDGYWLGVYLSSADGSDQATVLNTTIANATGYGIYIDSGDTVVRNAILTGAGVGYGLVRIAGTTTHSHNLLHGFSTPFYGTPADASEVEKDPQFVDSANGDFHLGVGSPAINAGVDLGSLVPTDMDGNARPSYNSYEIGAYEYVNPNGSFRVLDWTEKR